MVHTGCYRMQSISSYLAYESRLDRLHPLTKIVAVLVAAYLALISPNPILPLAIFVLAIPLAMAGKALKPLLVFITRYLGIIVLLLFLLHGLFYPANKNIVFQLGPIGFGKEGLLFALAVCGRLLAISSSFLLLTLTTHPGKMVTALVEAGLSPRAGYLVLATLQIVPQMERKAAIIRQAQKSRGLEVEGNLLVRARAFVPFIGPLVLGSLVDVQERAMTLETRALGARREITHYHVLIDSPAQKLFRRGAMYIAIGFTILVVITWLLGFLGWQR